MIKIDWENKSLDEIMKYTPVFVRGLYPHNQQTFDAMIDAIAQGKNLHISMTSGMGFKFAALEMLHAMPHFTFAYLTLTNLGAWQLQSQGVKTDIELDNVTFYTYSDIAEKDDKAMKDAAKGVQVVVLSDYMNMTAEQEGKVAKYLSVMNAETVVLGVSSIRPHLILRDTQLKKRFDRLLGEDAEMLETFTLRNACQFGNFNYPNYIAVNLAQSAQITKFCKMVKDIDEDGAYTRYINRAKYCNAPKEDMLKFVAMHRPSIGMGKYVVICAPHTDFSKEKEILHQIIPAMRSENMYFYDGKKEQESDVDKFTVEERSTELLGLFTNITYLQDIKITDATGVFIMYRVQNEWEMYQVLNVAIACCRLKYRQPYIYDMYNSNSNIGYVSPTMDKNTEAREMTCLFGELGITAEERSLYKKGEDIPLPYVQVTFPQTKEFDRIRASLIDDRIQLNDMRLFADTLDLCEGKNWPISPDMPLAPNGVNIVKWTNNNFDSNFSDVTPRRMSKAEISALRIRSKPYNQHRKKTTK